MAPPLCPPFFLLRGYPGSAKLVSGRHSCAIPLIAREGKRTTQGGPPSGDRKYGTGGDLALLRQRNHLRRKMSDKDWEVIEDHVRWM